MIIGNGLIASSFKKYKDKENIIVFASGVSDSTIIDKSNFLREKILLEKVLDNLRDEQIIIYFSTTSINDELLKLNPYQRHKLEMEKNIQIRAKKYLIFRLSTVIGYGGNQTNLINFFYDKVCHEESLYIWKFSKRNIIDIDYIKKIVTYIIDNDVYHNKIINIGSSKNFLVTEIVKNIEKICNKKAKIILKNKKSDYFIDISMIEPILKHLGIEELSLFNMIKKYKG